MSKLWPQQEKVKFDYYDAMRAGSRGTVLQLATGGGKTVILASIITEHAGDSCVIAHRGELVVQISTALAREGVRHDIIGSKSIIRSAVAAHMEDCGRSYYDPRARVKAASVDTLIRRDPDDPWFKSVTLAVVDEAHHVLRENKWGKALAMFPSASYVLPTATPTRADKKGLGSHADGLADALVQGPSMRWLIDNGFLTDYRVLCPRAEDLDLSDVRTSASGELNQHDVSRAVKRSAKIVADVVDTYKTHAMGLLGVTFCVDVEAAQAMTDAFNAAGVPAALVTANTQDDDRRRMLRMFRNREYLQLVNVDLFGEGFDLPAIQCVSLARPTASFSLFCQQFGRALRLMVEPELMRQWGDFTSEQRLAAIATSGKPFAWIFDHVGNVQGNAAYPRGHGLPDRDIEWTLDRGTKRSAGVSDGIPMRVCVGTVDAPGCQEPYLRVLDFCPHCGMQAPAPTERSAPEFVDGNLYELDAEVLQQMRGAVSRIDGQFYAPQNLPPVAAVAAARRHLARQKQQAYLRNAMDTWAATHADEAETVRMKRFYLEFGVDILSAMAYGAPEAEALRGRIGESLARSGIVLAS